MELTFQIRPLYETEAAPSEDLDNSLGLSATSEPTFFLRLVRKYDIPSSSFERMAVQTSPESIDDLRAQREEWKRRMQSFSKVTEPALSQIKEQAISYIEQTIEEYSTLPDNAGGK